MLDEDVLEGSNIDVDVKNGVVTLQGTVPSEAARARAIAVSKANDGVKNVVDQLKIAPPQKGTMARAGDKAQHAGEKAADKTGNLASKTGRKIDDGWIKSKIYAQYMADWNTILDDSNIDVDVKDNVVTLNGTVKSNEAKSKAVSVAKATDGVKSVRDNLRVVATY
jgi:hyperosmotically inducible protein